MTPPWASADTIDPADIPEFDVSDVVTEDDTPVDNILSEKTQRLLTEPLYSSWSGPPPLDGGSERRSFVAAANVGIFGTLKEPPIVPDVFLSLDVEIHPDFWKKENRTYFIHKFGKPPEVVIEIVSNTKGHELDLKLRRYAWLRVAYYVVWDPDKQLGDVTLQVYELRGLRYELVNRRVFDEIGLGVTEWTGPFENLEGTWLRWCLPDGTLIPTGAEQRDAEKQRADEEKQRADGEKQRADKLAERLRALGIDPDKL
jgi:Uma2 family endonuclease